MAPPRILTRDSSASSSASGIKIGSLTVPIYAIAGFSLVAFILLALVTFFIIRYIRSRSRRKREETRDSAFLVVKGVVKESGLSYKGPAFSRSNLTASVVLPEKTIKPDATNDDILGYYQQQGTMPRPFAPFSFALNAGHIQGGSGASSSSGTAVGTLSSSTFREDKRVSTQSFSASAARLPPSPTSPSHRFPSRLDVPGSGPRDNQSEVKSADKDRDSIADSFFNVSRGSRTSVSRGSLFGFQFGHNGSGNNSNSSVVGRVVEHLRTGSASSFGGYRFSVISGRSSLGGESYTNSTLGLAPRPVRQLFTPILPDELTLALGEKVTILQSFDDGWCVVARSTSSFGGKEGDVEMGAVPAWCFVKPMKGLRSERPVRSSSLGVTVQMEDESRPRDDIISWSNF